MSRRFIVWVYIIALLAAFFGALALLTKFVLHSPYMWIQFLGFVALSLSSMSVTETLVNLWLLRFASQINPQLSVSTGRWTLKNAIPWIICGISGVLTVWLVLASSPTLIAVAICASPLLVLIKYVWMYLRNETE